MRRVIIESPFAADSPDQLAYNLEYARAAMADCLRRGEAPYASHLLYTQPGVLDDKKPEERKLGIDAGFAWRDAADATVVYNELGVSKGMAFGIQHSIDQGKPLEYRQLGGKWSQPRDRIFNDTPSYWHGCWLTAGHYLFGRDGRSTDDRAFEYLWLDAGYAPMRDRYHRIVFVMQEETHEARRTLTYRCEELPQGQFLRHVIKNNRGEIHTMIAWWDRTQGDTRGACNSCYIVKGEHSSSEMLRWLPNHFPKQAERLRVAGVELLEVVPS